ncbi:response regulator [Chitinophaga solisilvae]|uniref:response regulator n=1 Tax=Chitinophaga solisilvae TaxID=1233460 RepID=UPI00136BD8AC|nr:response regulator [Chitinophaga solisilvae]
MNTGKILIVEDDLVISLDMQVMLESNGYTCCAVTSGNEAIDQVGVFVPDLILMDIGLNGKLDGMSTAGIIRQNHNLPIIFVTDQENCHVYKQAGNSQPFDYITKPFRHSVLLKTVQQALSQPCPPAISGMPVYKLSDRVSDGIFVYSSGPQPYKKVLFSDILFIESAGSYTNICCTNSRKFKVSLTSKRVILQMNCPALVKSNKSFHVNIHWIDSFGKDLVKIGAHEIPVSDAHKANLMSRLNRLGGGQA